MPSKNKQDSTDKLIAFFARIIFAKVRAAKRMREKISTYQLNRFRSTITADIRACGCFLLSKANPPQISEKARAAAKQLKIELKEHTWQTQLRFDKGRKQFHWEHIHPIIGIQKACEEASSKEEVFRILKERLRVAWILKSEDKELTRLGFRSNRPDPDLAYREAKIVLY